MHFALTSLLQAEKIRALHAKFMRSDKVSCICSMARSGLEVPIAKTKSYMDELWGASVPPCPIASAADNGQVPSLSEEDRTFLQKVLDTDAALSSEELALVRGIQSDDQVERELIFANKFSGLTKLYAQTMFQLHLQEKKDKKLTTDRVSLTTQLRTAVADFDLYIERNPMSTLFTSATDIRNYLGGVKHPCCLREVPSWSAAARGLANDIMDAWAQGLI